MWYVKHYGGMGSSEQDLPSDIWPLDLDNEDVKGMIVSKDMAFEMLKQFKISL